jgi:hypothetical protein
MQPAQALHARDSFFQPKNSVSMERYFQFQRTRRLVPISVDTPIRTTRDCVHRCWLVLAKAVARSRLDPFLVHC